MAIANIIIQQADFNIISISRDDLVLGIPVTLLNQDNSGIVNWKWQFIDIPEGSNAVLSTPNSASTTFIPDIVGTYLIQLTVNSGVSIDKKGAAVKTASLKYRIPAAAEEAEFDPIRGWAGAVNSIFRTLDDGYGSLHTGHISFDGYTIDLSAGATIGQGLVYNGTSFIAADVGGGGGGTITGSGVSGQITFWNGTSSITGNSHLTYDNTFFSVGESSHHIASIFYGDVGILNNLDTFGPSGMNIGTAHATSVAIGSSSIITTVEGSLALNNTRPLMFNSGSDGNWEMGRGLNDYTTTVIGSSNLGITVASGANEGFSVGVKGGTSILELVSSSKAAYFAGTLSVNSHIGITGSSAIYFNTLGDPNWRQGINLGYTKQLITGNSLDIIVGNNAGPNDGFSIGNTGGASLFELDYNSAYFAGSVGINCVPAVRFDVNGQARFQSTIQVNNTANFLNHIEVDGYTIDISGGATMGQALVYDGVSFVPEDMSGGGGVPLSRQINTTTGQLTGGGDLSADRTFGLATTAIAPNTYQGITFDAYGRATTASNQSYLQGTGVTPNTYNNVTVASSGLVTAGSNVGYLTTAVTNVATNSTLTGGPITTTGTLGINLGHANTWSAEQTFNAHIMVDGYTVDLSAGAMVGQVLEYNGTSFVASNAAATGVTSVATSAPITGGTITSTGTIGITQAGSSSDGYLSSTDWNIFNSKQPAGSYALQSTTINTTAPLSGGGDLSTPRTLSIPEADATHDGYLSQGDWTTFNNKGSVSSVATDSTLTGGTITTTGTLGINLSHANTWTAKQTFSSHIAVDGYTIDLSGGASNNQVLKYDGANFVASTLDIHNVLTVGISGNVDYSSIKTAVQAAITGGASILNQYLIVVAPGTYHEDPISITPGVNVSSHNGKNQAVSVVANNAALDLFTMTGGSLNGLNISGVTDPSYALIRCATSGANVIINNCQIGHCSNGIWIQNGGRLAAESLYSLITGAGQSIDTVLRFDGYGTVGTFTRLLFAAPSQVLPAYSGNPINYCVRVDNQAQVHAINVDSNVAYKNSAQVVFFADNGADILIESAAITNSYTAIQVGAGGSNTTITAQSAYLTGHVTNMRIDSATGIIFAAPVFVDQQTSVIVPGGTLSGIVQELNNKQTSIIVPTAISFPNGRFTSVSNWLLDERISGVSTGGVVSDNGGLSVNVSAGTGWINDGYSVASISWDDTTLSGLSASSTLFVYVDKDTLAPVVSPSVPAETQIALSIVITDVADIRYIHSSHISASRIDLQLQDYLLATRKFILRDGLGVSQGSTARRINIDVGAYYRGLELISFSAQNDATFSYFYGSDGYTEISGQQDLDVTQYDDGGVLTGMTDGYYRSDTVFITSDQKVSVIYGTAEYVELPDAQSANIANAPSFILDSAFAVANVIVEKTTGIVFIKDERIVSPVSATNPLTDHGELVGLADDDHPQYMLATGARPMSGDLDMGANNIIDVGLVDGVDVSAHAVRHQPGGIDAIATDVPVAVLVGASAAEGSAAKLARADHQHGIATASPVNVGISNLAGSASSVSRSDHVHALPSTGTSGSYSYVTFDAQGRETSGALVTLTGGNGINTIGDLSTNRTISVDQAYNFTFSGSSVSFTNPVSGVTPTSAAHLTTKAYVDGAVQGLDIKDPAIVLAASNIATLSGPTTIDGVILVAGNRVLLKGQSTASQNGIWIVQTLTWTRPVDFATGAEANGAFVFVQQGTTYNNTGWVCTTEPPNDVIDTNDLAFAQFSGAGTYTNGVGLDLTGNQFSTSAIVPLRKSNVTESLLTTTSAIDVLNYTTTVAGNYLVYVYTRVITATTNLTISITYTDVTGAQTMSLVTTATPTSVNSYVYQPTFINATSGTAIKVTCTAGTANQVYISGSIVGIT